MGLLKKRKIDFNVWKITLINVRIIVSPKDYKKWGKNYLQKNCNLNNWNLKTLLHIIPFAFGFSNMIWSRYKDQTVPSIFGQNLPGTKILTEELSWQTFKFLKPKSIELKDIQRIDLYPNSCILEFKDKDKLIGIILPTENIKFQKSNDPFTFSNFIGFHKNSKIIINNDFSSKKLGSKIEDLYYELDEIPIKMEELIKNRQNIEKFSDTSIFPIKLNSILEKNLSSIIDSREKNKSSFSIKKNKKKMSIPKKLITLQENKKNPGFLKGVILSTNHYFNQENIFFNNQREKIGEQKNQIFQDELNFLFYIQGIETNIVNENFTNKIPNFQFTDHCSNETLQLLKDFIKLKSINLDSLRVLSGYKYPDLSRQNTSKIALKFIFQKPTNNSFLKIQLPSNFITSLKDNVVLNSICCNPLPITSRKDNFLGVNELSNSKTQLFSENSNSDWKKAISQETIKRENKTFEDFDDFDPDSWFLSFPQTESKAINFEESFFLNYLQNKAKNENFYIHNSLYQKKDLNYHFLPFSETFIIEKSTTLLKVGDLYKRTPTFTTSLNENAFSLQKTDVSFFESWEPISLNSWMLVTQFSVGLFLLHLVKDLYKDYGKELVEYVLQFASSSGIDVEEIKEQYLYDDPGYRLIRKIRKSFKDIAGIDNILLQLGEIVWFLRNGGRSAKLKNSIPNGILLTGPPGTGKTLLVQAIAGEAQVPIIVESGSLLTDPQQKGRGVERLKKIFDQARKLSPCIIFIDEVDTLGEKRQNIIQTPMGSDDLIESIYEKSLNQKENGFIQKPLNLEEKTNGEKDLEYQLFRGETEQNFNTSNEKVQQKAEAKKTRLSLLTQFLVEMDGLKQRQGVIVIGATNRPNVLDPALIRPGRFDQVLNLELPGKEKRIEILKLYGKKLQVENTISWDYLAKRTRGFSAADIAAAMNESTIQSIIAKTTHTIETIEKGIDLVTSYNSDSSSLKRKNKNSDPFFLSRLAYYQSGKALLHSLLENHPPAVVLHLWPRPKNARHTRLYENSFSQATNRQTVEAQLIGLYAGKASEMIPLYGNKIVNSLKRWHSDFGGEDLISATFLANLLVDKWYFYSMEILIRKTNQIVNTRNEKEFNDLEKIELSKLIDNEIENELEIEKIAKLSRLGRYQQRGFGPWWQIQVAKQNSEIEFFFADWYRIYLPDPEENILNLEWIPPDEYHHSNESLKKLSEKSSVSFNELYKIERDYVFHGLILNSFNTAFYLVEEKREFLDYFSDYLLRFEIIRENEIASILKDENKKNYTTNTSSPLRVLETFWGKKSRRKTNRFFNLDTLNLSKKEFFYRSPFLKFNKKKNY